MMSFIKPDDIQIVPENAIDIEGVHIRGNSLDVKTLVLSNQDKLNKIKDVLSNHIGTAQEYAECPSFVELERKIKEIMAEKFPKAKKNTCGEWRLME